jgi:hypothetical protein
LAFVANAVDSDDSAALYEKVQHSRVELADVPQFKQSAADRHGKRRAVILSVPQLGQTCHDRREVAGIARFQFVKELEHRPIADW